MGFLSDMDDPQRNLPDAKDMHLKRPVRCEGGGCEWIGLNGDLIAKDKLRCPECGSDQIRYFISKAPVNVQ